MSCLPAAFRRPSRTDIDVKMYVVCPSISDIKVVSTDEDKAAAEGASFIAHWKSYVSAARTAG